MSLRSTLLALIIFAVFCCSGFAVNPQVLLHTNFGDITLELYKDKAPITVENFMQYARTGFYDRMIFHRVIPGFMIQGGGVYIDTYVRPYQDIWTNPPIINESYNGLSNLRGTVAMARTDDPNSATSQFFINVVNNGSAATGFNYCVFGHVVSDMNVVDTIAGVHTQTIYGLANYPYPTPVFIYSAKILTPGYWLNADIDNDGIANFSDFAYIAANWKKTVSSNTWGDLNQNNAVNFTDVRSLAGGWLQKTSWYRAFPEDVSDDGIVNLVDYAIFCSQMPYSGKSIPSDFNNDWMMDQKDFMLLTQHWLQSPR